MPPTDVDGYLEGLSPDRRDRVASVRALVRDVYPDISEGIEWRMPVFRRGDKWVAVASQKSYVSLYLGCEPLAARVAASNPKLKHGKGCVNVRDTVAMPTEALRLAIREALA